MSICKSELWKMDIDRVLPLLPELKELRGKTVLITGAAGLICSAVTDILIRANETGAGEEQIRICAAGRNEQKMRERFGEYYHRPYFQFVHYDSAKEGNVFSFRPDYIIHGAANSSPARIMREPVETMLGNFLGMKELLDLARESRARRVLFISSSEVYGKGGAAGARKEEEYGYVDILVPRNAYSVGKQAAETLCISYAEEYGLDPVIVRPGHIYGPTAARGDDHVSSAWAYDVASGRDIVMKSDGSQLRSYVYGADCASAILKVLLKGERERAYNISNPDSVISIREMAEILCAAGGVKLHMEAADDREKKSFNPMNDSSLNSDSLIGLGWKGLFDAETGFAHTLAILKEILTSEE